MSFTYKYPRPSMTVDCVIFGTRRASKEVEVLLIRRGDDPFKGRWANPGGFLNVSDDPSNQGETLESAARRELLEETGVRLAALRQFGIFDAPGRDPRGRVITVGYYAVIHCEDYDVEAGDDAAEAEWFPLSVAQQMNLAFDHNLILNTAVEMAMYEGAF